MDALPPPPPVIVVQRAQDSAPLVMLGFMAVGEEKSMRALESAASSVGLKYSRARNDRNEPEVMVMFPPGSPRDRSLQLYGDAQAGQFGPLRLEVIIIPVSAAADGIDFEREVSAEPPAYITEPRN